MNTVIIYVYEGQECELCLMNKISRSYVEHEHNTDQSNGYNYVSVVIAMLQLCYVIDMCVCLVHSYSYGLYSYSYVITWGSQYTITIDNNTSCTY